jgi:spermidine synthase
MCLRAEEKVLYQRPSAFSTIVVTENEQGLRTLRFEVGGVRQSVVKPDDPDHLELAYARVMPAALALAERPGRVLIVGLGGGTIPRFLHQHFPELAIDVVEIDPDVVAVAKQFFGFREDARMRAHVADGRAFIAACRQRYDLILLDAFSSDSIPIHLATREFLMEVRRALTPNGLVAGNVWGRGSNPLYDSMVRTYQAVFPEVCIVDVTGSGNRIVLGLMRQRPVRGEEFARQVSEMSRTRRFPLDMGEAVKAGFRSAQDDGSAGRVLTDAEARAKAG